MSGADYFTYSTLVAGELARASDVNTRMAAVQTAFDKLPAPSVIQENRQGYVTDSGLANAMVVSMPTKALSSYTAGLELSVLVGTTNTGASTLNVDGVGAKTILRANGSALSVGDLTSGYIVKLVYDGTNFRLIGASETAAAASATAAATSATEAAASASAAATSATNAANSATAAASSATDAANSATAAATSASDAATAVSGYVAKTGSTMTGALVLYGAPAADLQAATKKYVDDAIFASGSAYTADVATITLTGSEFGLSPVATATVLGNVSGSSAKPGALTATQLTALLNAATTGLQGAMSAADKTKLDAISGTNTGDQTNISGNAATATALQTARTIAISGGATGTATAFDGTGNISIPVTALNMDNANAGTLAVARGGTGVATETGTGSNVLSASPALTGTPTAPTAASGANTTQIATTAFVKNQNYAKTSDNVASATKLQTARTIAISGTIITGTATSFNGTANISIPVTTLNVGNATAGTLAVARGGTGVTSSTGTGNNVLSASPTFTGTLSAATITASGNVTAYSDERLKTGVFTIADGLDSVKAMRGVSFRRKADGSRSSGVIAQELEAIAPELVTIDKDGYMAVNYLGLSAYFIEAIKSLSARVEALEA